MTEREWLEATDPEPMLYFLRQGVSERKLRLWAAACCRRVWDRLDYQERQNIEVTERYADGTASDEERRSFASLSYRFPFDPKGKLILEAEPDTAARNWAGIAVVHRVMNDLGTWRHPEFELVSAEEDAAQVDLLRELAVQADLLRELFANPFCPITRDPSWLTWHDGLIVSMAQQMYESRDFSDMPVLADALEEAGCTNPDVLSHCRQQGAVHVRGCFVLGSVAQQGIAHD
jgi:hypothetical protein